MRRYRRRHPRRQGSDVRGGARRTVILSDLRTEGVVVVLGNTRESRVKLRVLTNRVYPSRRQHGHSYEPDSGSQGPDFHRAFQLSRSSLRALKCTPRPFFDNVSLTIVGRAGRSRSISNDEGQYGLYRRTSLTLLGMDSYRLQFASYE